MSPSRAPTRGYRPPRRRLEVMWAVLGVAVILLIAVALIWVLAPEDPEELDLPEFTPPPAETSTTLPGAITTPTTVTPTSTPG